MNVILVQLSDIHIRYADDVVLTRFRKIADAVRGIHYQADLCVLLFNGDVTFSGSDEEYALAYEFVNGLSEALSAEPKFASEFAFVLVPGNHDCDFSGAQGARQLMIDGMTRGSAVVDESVLQICTGVEHAFFDFRDVIEGVEGPRGLYWEKTIGAGVGRILFRCYNTAWMSRIKESPGTLLLPTEQIPVSKSDADVVISILHHPYNWFSPDNAREVRTVVEGSSDIILTGHEHAQTRRLQRLSTGELNEYIEGGVLQETGRENVSTFNVLLLDTQDRQQKVFAFAWDDDIYRTDGSPDWEPYHVNRLRQASRFAVDAGFSCYLRDLGLRLEHPVRGVLSFDDVFIYPDLREYSYRPGEASQIVKNAEELSRRAGGGNVLLIGAEQSGKTALAKMLFRSVHEQGYVPVLLDGGNLRSTRSDRMMDQVVEAFRRQYSAGGAEHYRQLDASRRIILVDNFHKVRMPAPDASALLQSLEAIAGQVLLFSNDMAQHLNEVAANTAVVENRPEYREYRILQFGHLLRSELAQRWCMLDPAAGDNQEELARRILLVERVMDTVIGKNFVPAYPVFLLALLQGQDGTSSFNTNAGTYGYFYELLIRNSLARGSERVQMDIKLGYLAHLAYQVFLRGATDFSDAELREIHTKYELRYSFKLHLETSSDELVKHGILDRTESTLAFKYRYIYYYFVASYLKDHMSDADVRQQISMLSKHLDDEDSANIMLFLAHLSKDPYIIGEILINAAAQYEEHSPATLSGDTKFLRVDESQLATTYVEKDVATARRERLKQQDEAIYEHTEEHAMDPNVREEFGAYVSLMTRLNAALRTMQILGQLLKNFVGTMEGDQKARIAKECYMLGLRSLSSMLTLLRENHTDIVELQVQALREENPGSTDRELARIARGTIFGMAHMLGYSMVKRISHSVGSRDLQETYAAVHAELTAGEGSPAVDLIQTSLQLDQFGLFPAKEVVSLGKRFKGQALPTSVLRHMVVNHFHMFSVQFQVKQTVCAQLGISYERMQRLNPGNRLVDSDPQRAKGSRD